MPVPSAPSTQPRLLHHCLLKFVLSSITRLLRLLCPLRRRAAPAVIDNLVKGASGQAIQNMNVMWGLPEETALLQQALFP